MKYPNNPEQSRWLTRTKYGDRQAFNNIVQKYQRPIYNLCYHMLQNVDESEDAAQEIFLRAYSKLNLYDDRRQFSTWLFSIASHYCIDRLKRPRVRWISWDYLAPGHLSPEDQNTPQPERVLIEMETIQEARALLNSLSSEYQAAIILKYWYSMSYQEIAQTLDTTVSVIKSRLFRARRMMAQAAIQLGRPMVRKLPSSPTETVAGKFG